MREIKFRAWWGNIMLNWGEIQHHPGWRLFPTEQAYPDWKIMQYTGLQDKNGKEIYEGDVTCAPFAIDIVRYEEGGFWPFCIPGSEDNEDPEECEVIGNIYENPELVNGKETA